MNSPCTRCPHVQHGRDLADPTPAAVQATDRENGPDGTLIDQLVVVREAIRNPHSDIVEQMQMVYRCCDIIDNVIEAIQEH